MPTLLKAALALGTAASLTACVHVSEFPERGPAPPPPPGYKVVCSSNPIPFYTYLANCEPVREEKVIKQRTVVRAKG